MKKILVLLLAMILSVSLFAGCAKTPSTEKATTPPATSNDESSETSETVSRKYPLNEAGYPDLNGEKITIWSLLHSTNAEYTDDIGNMEVIKVLEEKTNCDIDFIHPPIGQENDAFSIMISSGEWPDMITYFHTYYPGGVTAGVNDGILLAANDYIDEYAPNFKGMLESDDNLRKLAYNDDGVLTGFGGYYDNAGVGIDVWYSDACYLGPVIRKDWLKDADMDVPKTIDDWYKVLTAFKNNGVEVPYGWYKGGRDNTEFVATFSGAYGVYNDFMVKEDGTVTYGPIEQGFKDYVSEMSKWYEEGLINPDFPNQNFTDNVAPMLASNKVGAVTCHVYDYWSKYYDPIVVKGNAPEQDLVAAPFPVLKEGSTPNRFRHNMGGLETTRVITTKAKSPEACVALLDTLYKDEINEIMNYGIEGKFFEKDDDGNPQFIQMENPTEEFLLSSNLQMFRGIQMYNKAEKPLSDTYAQTTVTWKNSGTYDGKLSKSISFTEDELKIISKYQTNLKTYSDEWLMKFMVGVESIDSYDKFIDEMQSLHVQDLIDIYQAGYDRFMARGK